MSALTIGITSARFPECKRGLAVNLAASRARDAGRPARVCVVDADPLGADVTTRLAVTGPTLEDFAAGAPAHAAVRAAADSSLWVLPSRGGGRALAAGSAARAVRRLRPEFDVVVCDLAPLGGEADASVLADGVLDWLLVAVTPDIEPVEATAHVLAGLDVARARGEVSRAVRVGVVTTGDEASTDLAPAVVARALRRPVLASVRQLWGRAVPNAGFGAALGIAELDDAVGSLFDRLAAGGPGSRSAGPDRRVGASPRALRSHPSA